MSRATLTVDLGYGDSGKGIITAALVHQYKSDLVVRYNGACQCGHNVITNDSRHHTFSQFGSGTFTPGVRTLLSKFVLVNPLIMQHENDHLKSKGVEDAFDRMYVDGRALVTTPYHRAANRLIEIARDQGRHGSCGMGVGTTAEDALERGPAALRVADILDKSTLWAKLRGVREAMMRKCLGLRVLDHDPIVIRERSTFEETALSQVVARYEDWAKRVHIIDAPTTAQLINGATEPIFEGAQGVMLDEKYGFHPYTTWSNTTLDNARQILTEIGYTGSVKTLGILRTFSTRHGPGPFVPETRAIRYADKYNPSNQWQQAFRVGFLDFYALQYTLEVTGKLDGLAVTHVDTLDLLPEWEICTKYLGEKGQQLQVDKELMDKLPLDAKAFMSHSLLSAGFETITVAADMVITRIEQTLKTPVAVISNGPKTGDKFFL